MTELRLFWNEIRVKKSLLLLGILQVYAHPTLWAQWHTWHDKIWLLYWKSFKLKNIIYYRILNSNYNMTNLREMKEYDSVSFFFFHGFPWLLVRATVKQFWMAFTYLTFLKTIHRQPVWFIYSILELEKQMEKMITRKPSPYILLCILLLFCQCFIFWNVFSGNAYVRGRSSFIYIIL